MKKQYLVIFDVFSNCFQADPTATDSHGASAWDYARAKQLHYCMLIIASYIRQKAKEEEADDIEGALSDNGGTLDTMFRGSMDATTNGINTLQVL